MERTVRDGRLAGAAAPEGGDADGERISAGPEFRLAAGTGGRVALEVVVGGEVVAVDVANAFSARVLGALRGGVVPRLWTVAWGRLPEGGGADVTVEFGRAAPVPVEAVGPFWVARARGRCGVLTVREGALAQRWRPARVSRRAGRGRRDAAPGGTLEGRAASTS